MQYRQLSRKLHPLESLAAPCLCLLLWACDLPPSESFDGAVTVDASVSADQSPDTSPDATAPDSGPTLPTLKAGWTIIETGGKTICSRGTKYAFGVRPGKVNRLVVDFEGGGACWTHPSCSVSGALFKEDVDKSLQMAKDNYSKGIYDAKNAKNPFKDWYHVFIPYCTGDIHWGDKVTTYTSKDGKNKFEINHKGAVNAQAVLSWVYKNFSKPEKIFVTGCSAGSYGSILWSAHLAKHYSQSKVYQFGDSGAGVITDSFLKDSVPQWNALPSAPSWIPGMNPKKIDILGKDLGYVYKTIANHYPKQMFSQYNTLADKTQIFYYQTMGGGTAAAWTTKMVANMDSIIKDAKTFRAYLPDDKTHCIVPYDEFYTTEVGGVKLTDWLFDMLADKPIKNVRCSKCVPAK